MLKSKEDLKNCSAYQVIQEESIEELKSLGILLRHKKSGARLLVLSNEDNNKVFSIGFRTPPKDSTGVAHIIEHTVLCGSKEFPAKDPFVELVKGSLNTFLNAMTYPDKTVYPIASCNDKDFQNLMHVYLDAVFYPNIYNREEIFKQEGWHYELEKEDGELKYNGVVYNEMKGVFSSPEQLLDHIIQQSVFPDTTYRTESGGDPKVIPDLTYEQFLEFHKQYYHPSNSYIYLYGDMDIEEKLNWIDQHYLSKFNSISVDSKIAIQQPFAERKEVVDYYSVTDGETTEEKTYLAYNTVIKTSLEKELYLAFQILEYVLLEAPGAVLKQALLDAKIGKDVLGSYDNSILQPIFSIILKNSEEEKKEEFFNIIKKALDKVVKEGINKKSLEGALNYFEFKYREADFGYYPKGLMYGLQILDSWLYDDEKAFIHLKTNETFNWLRKQIGTRYYEDLIQNYLLNNTHASCVVIKPKVGLTEQIEGELQEKLNVYQQKLSKEEKQELIEATKQLKRYQEIPSSKEELEKIPLLTRKDITKEIEPILNEEKQIQDIKILHHNIYTNGIGYIKLMFDISNLNIELAPYISLLSSILGYIDTEHYTLSEFSDEVNIYTGGITTDINTYVKNNTTDDFKIMFEVKTKVLYEKISKAFAFIEEMLYSSKLEDEKRLKEIIEEGKSRIQMYMNGKGHIVAMNRATSYFSKAFYYEEWTSGIEYYRFLENLETNFEQEKEKLMHILKNLISVIFQKSRLFISYTADNEGYQFLEKELGVFDKWLSLKKEVAIHAFPTAEKKLEPECKNEGFKTAGQVQFVARSGNFMKSGYCYTGALKVLKVILSYDYLWNNVRVKGGAYGCMCGFTRDGNGYFVSYRDPNLAQTNEIYKQAYQYIENFTAQEREMTKYIIGTISSLDTPLTPSAKGSRSLTAYLCEITEEDIKRERQEVLNISEDGIRALAPLIKTVIDDENICVIGNEKRLEENRQLFKTIKNLL